MTSLLYLLKVWLSLAEQYIRKLKIDWSRTVRLVFNERSNPDDDKIGFQIVKASNNNNNNNGYF